MFMGGVGSMLDRTFAGFHAIFITLRRVFGAGNADIKQALTRTRGGADDEHQAMLCRTFAVYIKLCISLTKGKLMNVSFSWETDAPSEAPSKEHIQDSLLMALEIANTRNLDPTKLIVRLTTDKTQTAVDGVGYDQNAKPLFICSCSLAGPTASYYCYYYGEKDPRKLPS